ncbi:hypothetical protein LCGC14_0795140 [marine sediment metagenome]|uniref:G domain-containing protein n=1 Tax=marine sediment metagenome TaxID=412755 RepID=A0A0F9PVR2_9ZZZZ
MSYKQENLKKRVCWKCKNQLNFKHFCGSNKSLSLERAKDLWFNSNLEFFCCKCYIEREGKILHVSELKKVLILGFPNSGKTAITHLLKDRYLEDPESLLPTRGISIQFCLINNGRIAIWDLGGASTYRRRWIERRELIFPESNKVIYVIDIQDSLLFNVTIKYFSEIFNSREICDILGPELKLHVLFHKTDPDIRNSPTINKNVEILTQKINSINIPFKYEISKTSIYSFNPNISDSLLNS